MNENPSQYADEKKSSKKWLLLAFLLLLLFGGALAAFLIKRGGHSAGGMPKITLDDSKGGHRLLIDGKPFFIRGVCYNPVPIGQNFKSDFFGKDSPALGVDGDLMKQANINTIRLYHAGTNAADVKLVINGLYKKHGIFSLLGHHLAFWEWPPANYADPKFREHLKKQVLDMVRTYKDEPGVLGWILGNENNYSFDLDVRPWTSDEIDALATPEERRLERAKIYYTFINDMAKEVKKIDKRHPVIMGVGETKSLDIAAKYATDIDILGMIAYRGSSFGNLFREIKQKMDKAMMLIEFGCDRYNVITQKEEENFQAEFIKMQWRDILKNSADIGGAKNCLGGTLFEWSDEWWKGNDTDTRSWSVQDSVAHWRNVAYYYDADKEGLNNMNEEWWGIVRLDPNKKVDGHDARIPTKAYNLIKQMWGAEKK